MTSHDLTERETSILFVLAQGLSYELTADCLGLTVGQVKNSLALIKCKLNARNTTQAVAIAIRQNLIP